MDVGFVIVTGVLVFVSAVVAYFVGKKAGRENQALSDNLAFTAEREAATTTRQRLETELALALQAHTQVQTQLSDLLSQNTNLGSRAQELQVELADRTSSLSVVNNRVEERDLQIASLRDSEINLKTKQAADEELIRNQQKIIGEANQLKIQIDELRNASAQREAELESTRSSLSNANSRIAELQTELSKDREALVNERKLLEDNKSLFRQEFENLAHQIFEKKHVTFDEQSKQGLDALLTPFKQQLEAFRLRVDEVHTQNVQGNTSIKVELDKLRELNQQVTTEASNLTRALKGDKKIQGNWGEQKVELLLEQSNLRNGFEYEREKNFKNDEAENLRPDFVVRLPESKHIIIDSKVSLVAYNDYVAGETDEARQQALAAHIVAIRNHVSALSSRNYPELLGVNSPDFVFMFVAIEPAYMVIAEHSPSLFQEAYEKRIAIVTATTLGPVLRVVANLWSLQRQNQSTKLIVDQATGIYDKLRIFVQKMEILGKQIGTVQNTYADTFNVLKDGKGSLTKRVDKFFELGVKVRQRLPSNVTDDTSPDDEPDDDSVNSMASDVSKLGKLSDTTSG